MRASGSHRVLRAARARSRGARATFGAVLFGALAPTPAAVLPIDVTDDLLTILSGDAGDRSATKTIDVVAADPFYLRDGSNTASFTYRISAQVSADDSVFSGSDDFARIVGEVSFAFDLPPAIWDVDAFVTYSGMRDSDSGANTSVGPLDLTSTGIVAAGTLTLTPTGNPFFEIRSGRSIANAATRGAGSYGVAFDVSASSDHDGFNDGGEAYVGLGLPSPLGNFALDDTLIAQHPFDPAGITLELVFRPGLALAGDTLAGPLTLEAGETLSGHGTVTGRIRGGAGTGIRPTGGGLVVGNPADSGSVEIDSSIVVGDSSLQLDDLVFAHLGGPVSLAGGVLTGPGGLLLDTGASLTGHGTVSGWLIAEAGSTIALTGPLTFVNPFDASRSRFRGAVDIGPHTLSVNDASFAATTLGGGTLTSPNAVIFSGGSLSGHGVVDASVIVGTGTITAAGGDLVLGRADEAVGFDSTGLLEVGDRTVTLLDADAARLGAHTTLAGGVLRAVNGLELGPGDVVTGFGVLVGEVSGTNAAAGLLIANPTGTVNLGASFEAGSHTAVFYSDGPAGLAQATGIAGGTLAAANGLLLDAGRTIAGHGEVAADLENRGTVAAQAGVLELAGRVTGAGDYTGQVAFSGTFAPGGSPGLVALEDFLLTGVLEIEIGGLVPGTQHDQLVASGSADLTGGTLAVSLVGLGGESYTPSVGDAFDLVLAQAVLGDFETLALAPLPTGLAWQLDILRGQAGSDVVRLATVAAVPLPGSAWLLAGSAVVLLWRPGRGTGYRAGRGSPGGVNPRRGQVFH